MCSGTQQSRPGHSLVRKRRPTHQLEGGLNPAESLSLKSVKPSWQRASKGCSLGLMGDGQESVSHFYL